MMDEGWLTRLQRLSKSELVRRVAALSQENLALRRRLEDDGGKDAVADSMGFPHTLGEDEELFQVCTENLQAVVYIHDSQGRVVYVNPYAERLFGYRVDEIVGRPAIELIHPDHREAARQRIRARLAGKNLLPQRDIPIVHKDGHLVWIELHARRVELGGQSYVLGTASDVTERKRNEDALRRSEERFRLFTHNVQAGVFLFRRQDSRLVYVNSFMTQLTGFPCSELIGRKVLELVHPDSRKLARKPNMLHYVLKVNTRDQRERWADIRVENLRWQDERMVLGVALDITHRIEAEQALRASEQKFRDLFELSFDPMLMLDRDRFFDCNPAAVRFWRVADKREILQHPARLSPERQPDGRLSLEKAEEIIAQTYQNGLNRFEWLYRDCEGRSLWTDVTLTVIPFAGRRVIFAVCRDISEFKRLEALLREEQEQLLVTLRSIGDAVVTTDLEGRVTLMNRVAERLTGWSQSEARERLIEEVVDLREPESGRPLPHPLRRAIEQGMVLELTGRMTLRSRDGLQLQVADSASPIRDEKSRIIGGVLVFRDVTERERMQEEVLKLRKLESVGRLAGGIAHDFNNLLTGIMGNIEVARMRASARRDEQLEENLQRALKASRRAADLTQKLLIFAKGGEPIRETADIGEIICDSAEFPLLGSNVDLELELDADLWAAEVDPGQISQVIQNLVINADQAMPAGGTITIRGENVVLSAVDAAALSLRPGAYVKIRIRDQGCGIPRHLSDRIFDPFFTTREGGSGLGLSVVHSIVTKHNGRVLVSSEPGIFTEFTLYLPALRERWVEKDEDLAEPEDAGSRGGRILVMDDDAFVREVMGETLRGYGYEVELVSDGEEALRSYAREPFDLVIIDLTIPGGLGGRETIARLRELDPGVRAVVASGYSNSPVMADYERYGFCGCLHKPYAIADLLELLRRVLG